jgi:hypothetical protein
MIRIWIIALAGCAVSPSQLASNHPASATAPPGRLAPAPASLRAGVIAYPDVPKPSEKKPAGHHHHHHP